jgi:hypothetical protein
MQIWIQGFDDQKLEKFTAVKENLCFLLKICSFILERTSKLQQEPSPLNREHPALQHIEFLDFFSYCGLFCPPGSRSGSAFPVQIRIWIQSTKISVDLDTDPDPKHCLKRL